MKGPNLVNQIRPTAGPAKEALDLQAFASLLAAAGTSADLDVYIQRAEVLSFAGLPDVFGDFPPAMAANARSVEELSP